MVGRKRKKENHRDFVQSECVRELNVGRLKISSPLSRRLTSARKLCVTAETSAEPDFKVNLISFLQNQFPSGKKY